MFVIQLDGFRIDHNVGTVVQKLDDGTASLMYDLHSAGLRIDLAYLLGVAVLDADHDYLLCIRVCIDHISPLWKPPRLSKSYLWRVIVKITYRSLV